MSCGQAHSSARELVAQGSEAKLVAETLAISRSSLYYRRQPRTGRADRSPYGRVLMAAEIVHHHDIAWPQSWNQELHHPGEETLGVDGAIQDARRGNPITSQPGHEGECLALAVRNLGDQALASGAAAMQAGHIRLRPGLINEDQTGRTNLALPLLPLSPTPRDISAVLLAGTQAFF